MHSAEHEYLLVFVAVESKNLFILNAKKENSDSHCMLMRDKHSSFTEGEVSYFELKKPFIPSDMKP